MAGIRDISDQVGIEPQAGKAFIEAIVARVLSGEQVQLRGLGTFRLDMLSGRAYGNPQIGTLTYKDARPTVKFKIARSLKEDLKDYTPVSEDS